MCTLFLSMQSSRAWQSLLRLCPFVTALPCCPYSMVHQVHNMVQRAKGGDKEGTALQCFVRPRDFPALSRTLSIMVNTGSHRVSEEDEPRGCKDRQGALQLL